MLGRLHVPRTAHTPGAHAKVRTSQGVLYFTLTSNFNTLACALHFTLTRGDLCQYKTL